MAKEYSVEQLDLLALVQAGEEVSGVAKVSRFPRLAQETLGAQGLEHEVRWRALGESRPVTGGPDEVWLHLEVQAVLALGCQRCLGPVDVPIEVERSFRFVKDEATAEAQDDESEEDVLVLARDFNLLNLIEDEVLLELPLVPKHETCPLNVQMSAQGDDFEQAQAQRPNPFAALAQLKKDGLN